MGLRQRAARRTVLCGCARGSRFCRRNIGPVIAYTRKFMTRLSRGAFPVKFRDDGRPDKLAVSFDCASIGKMEGADWDKLVNARTFHNLQEMVKHIADNCDRSLEETTVRR